MKQLTIKTPLVGRTETFKTLAVAHATSKPILLIGDPGVGKTKALLDYGLALHGGDAQRTLNETFILETDESTRSPEIKGRPDLKKIVEENTYDVISPITSSKFVLINEIDKANAGLRNSMLSVMNEKVLFNGIKKVMVPWELFCASCNSIPSEEKNSPFWDRFVIKHEVKRISKTQMMKYYADKKPKDEVIIIPEKHELDQIETQIPEEKLKKFLDVGYKYFSDRTLSFVPRMTAAVSVVFQLDLNRSLVKTAQILGDKAIGKELAANIEPTELIDMRSKIDMVQSLEDYDQINALIQDITEMARRAANSPEVSKEDLEGIAKDLNKALQANPFYSPENTPDYSKQAANGGNVTSVDNGGSTVTSVDPNYTDTTADAIF